MATAPRSRETEREAGSPRAADYVESRPAAIRSQVLQNGIKLVGEVLVPGASQLLEGRVGKGVTAAGVGLGVPALSAMLLGPIAALIVGRGTSIAVRLLSYSDSLTPDDQKDWGFRNKAMDILEQRYARGEINTDEYLERKGALR